MKLKAQRLDADSSELTSSAMLDVLRKPLLEIEDAITLGFPPTLAKPLLARWRKLSSSEPKVSGKDAFHLYETFGLPLDFMVDAARDAGIAFDMEGFEKARAEEQARARASWKGGSKPPPAPLSRAAEDTLRGVPPARLTGCEVLALVKDGLGMRSAGGRAAEVVLDHTSFYADSGGQVGDIGWLYSDDGNMIVADVLGCTKPVQGIFAHKAVLQATACRRR